MNSVLEKVALHEEESKLTSDLLVKKLEQLGYQCLSDSCDRFTTMRLVPLEIKRKEEALVSSSE